MQNTSLGNSGLSVSRLGLGLAALGRPGYINLGHGGDLGHAYDVGAMEARAHVVLDAAWTAGIRYFDAARSYGRAEAFLASWLTSRNISPNAVTVGSKWGYSYTAGWKVEADKHEIKDHSPAVLKRQYAESQTLLGPYLDLYQIHSATLDSGVLDDAGVLQELGRMRAQGLRIGLSLSGAKQPETLRKAMAAKLEGVRVFDCVQATWNVLEPSAGEALAEAHAEGMGVIVKEALANGRLTARNDELHFASRRGILQEMATKYNATVDALGLAAALAQPWADVVLSGAATVEHLQSNLRALDVRLDAPALTALGQVWEKPEEYWATRAALPWN